MGILTSLREKRFWLEWEDRFTDDIRRYITPNNPKVNKYADTLQIDEEVSPYQVARQLWAVVDSTYQYKLSKEWKTPSQTIREGIGDCEDYVFLIGSLLPHFGVNGFEVVIGEVSAGEDSQKHTWMRVSGKVVDPTTTPGTEGQLDYTEQQSFQVNLKA